MIPMLAIALAIVVTAPLAPQEVQDLGSVPGTSSYAWAVSANGGAALGQVYPAGEDSRWVWNEALGFRTLEEAGLARLATFAISGDGSVVGGTVRYPGQLRDMAAIWDATTGVRTELFSLPGGNGSTVKELSQDGSVAAGPASVVISNVGHVRTFRWSASTGMQDIVGTNFSQNAVFGSMNLDGSVIVGGLHSLAGGRETFHWTLAGGLQPLPPVFNTSNNHTAQHVSNDGRFIAGTFESATAPSGLYYYDSLSGTVDFGLSAGLVAPVGLIFGMSGDGQTLLVHGDPSTTPGATFLWQPATNSITTIEPTGRFYPRSISDDGSVVVGDDTDPVTGVTQAARWTPVLGLEILDGLGGANVSAARVSADGTTVLGSSELPNGEYHPVLWRADRTLGEVYCAPAVPNSTGQSGELSLSGSNHVDLGRTVLRAENLPPGAAGFFLGSTSADFAFPVMSSQGALCLGGAIGRFVGPGQVQIANSSGEFALTIDPGQLPSPTGFVTASFGEAWYFQAWHRDVAAGGANTSNFTNGATVRFY